MEKYSEYRPCEIQWMESIPSHWKVVRGKYLYQKEERPVSEEDGVITCFRDGEVTLRTNRRTTGFTESLKEIGYQGIKKGDLVIHQMDAFAGSVGVSDSDGKGSPVLSVCTPKFDYIINSYYARVIRNMGLNGFIQSLYRGIRERSSDFRFDTFGRQFLPVPPLSEQTAIVAYLDAETAKMDKFVSQKEKEIDLLEKLKQRIIADAVTRGLDPNATLVPCDIPWIKQVPNGWKQASLRELVKLVSEKNHPDATLLSVTREQGVIIRNTESKEENHNFIPEDLSNYKYVRKGQFAINKMKSWQGSYGVSDYDGIVSPAYYVCDLNFENKEFFSMAIRSKAYLNFFIQYSKGIRVDQWDLSTVALKNIPFLVPPLPEQQQIVAYIKAKSEKIDKLKAGLQQEIDKVKLFKQRLISDVVTGQVKVC